MAWLTADRPFVAVSPVTTWLDALLLCEASFEGHEKDVRLLFEIGAKIKARFGPYGRLHHSRDTRLLLEFTGIEYAMLGLGLAPTILLSQPYSNKFNRRR